ncbi:M16 family metallopeptidase [Lactobacillus gigeriorum]|uniref:Protease n=1 Tax=Lactobacillus gigeriorum DSM 23908 = CRBIP 24.85 TaxID=1423751 RepID=I7LDH1_9LACO|nr:insulinase family protein [Lactobacillus gigeriorum]KRN14866.1 protease [Lactobacillus gigeriorum DSM 23908 = CRBIP 24.85]CCI87331.1 Probable protease [Lactobacillus gigeriorum DSM 23908 = CRBIP 24.85]
MKITVNSKIIPNTKFTTAMIGCFLRLPLTRHNLAYASLLTRMQLNASLYYPSIGIQEKTLSNLYDLSFDATPQLFGKEIVISYLANFIEPQEILDPEYTYEKIISTVASIVQHPLFDQDLLNYTKSQLSEDLQELLEEPANYALDRFFKLWYEQDPDYGDNFMGPLEEIEGATVDSLKNFSDGLRIVPATIVGFARDDQQVTNIINQNFKQAGLIKRFQIDDLTIPAPHKDALSKIEKRGNLQAQIMIGYGFAGKMTYRDQIAGMVLAQYLAGDQSSKLFVRVREELGAAYAIDSNNYSNNSLFLISAGLDPELTEQAIQIIKDEIVKISDGQIDPELFKKAKKSLKNLQLVGRDQENWQLAQALRKELFAGYAEFDRDQAISRVTSKQLISFAQKLFLNESYVLQ